MTRKRFVKLLMAHGIPRNLAVNGFAACGWMWGSYDRAWHEARRIIGEVDKHDSK
jgi:hypothetical protein